MLKNTQNQVSYIWYSFGGSMFDIGSELEKRDGEGGPDEKMEQIKWNKGRTVKTERKWLLMAKEIESRKGTKKPAFDAQKYMSSKHRKGKLKQIFDLFSFIFLSLDLSMHCTVHIFHSN